MNWTPITPDDLNDAKFAAVIDAARTKGLAEGQDDPVLKIIQAVVDRIRRKVGSCKFNKLDADPQTIPNGLKSMAVDYIVAECKNRIEDSLTDDEKAMLQRHDKDLDRIANCQDAVEQPDTPQPAPVIEDNTGSPSVSSCPPQKKRALRG
jgi:hypothetical protein